MRYSVPMADISAKLVELSADKLRDLHKRLHLLKSTSANIEAHHLTTVEMRRRGMEIGYDKWDQYEILVDVLKQADLRKLGAFPDDMIEDVIKETGSAAADVQTVLTSKGYEMRLEPVEKVIREYKGKFTVYNADETQAFGTYNTRMQAEARLNQMHQFKKHNPGQHDQKTHGKWADNIADAINNGEHPEVEPENVTAFLMGAAKRTDHPDLTELSVAGTLLYGDEGMGILRKDMPQIPAERRGEFLSELKAEGITVEEEAVDPKTLKPIQKEVSASRAGAIYNKYKEAGTIPQEQRILISSDGFVIDGHHTWGAAVGFSFDNKDAKLPVYRIGLTAQEALDRSLAWTEAQGIEGQAIDAKAPTEAKKSLAWRPLTKHGGHADQKVHGKWAHGGGDTEIPEIKDTAPIEGRDPNAVQLATTLRNKIISVEPKITKMMQDLAEMSGGKLEGLQHRVKSTDSLARKIAADAVDEKCSQQEAAAKISDAIRYTMTMDESEYTAGFERVVKTLESSGFELRTKNFWQPGDPYDGANIKAVKDGVAVEIQIHTPQSLKYKEEKLHPIYEKYREEKVESVRESHWNKMIEIANEIPRPSNYGALLTIGKLVIQNYQTAQEAGLIKSTLVDKLSPMRGVQA